jgi:Peptidase inhibitor I78 family
MDSGWLPPFALLIIGLASGCGPTASPSAVPDDDKTAPLVMSENHSTADTSSGQIPPIVPIYPPLSSSDTTARKPKYLPNCPGMSVPTRRVKGSNCFGILPAVCGADKAASYVGIAADAKVREAVTNLVGHKNIRWTSPGQAEIENLDPDRLNMLLDERGRIAKVDCY